MYAWSRSIAFYSGHKPELSKAFEEVLKVQVQDKQNDYSHDR